MSVPGISDAPVRRLALDELGLGSLAGPAPDLATEPASQVAQSGLAPDDAVLASTRRAGELGYAGVILSGPPGTGKSWYAQRIAMALTGDSEAVRTTQFHPSYQYEDFVYGYRPNDEGVFEPTAKVFAQICDDARGQPDQQFVLVIDEFSRSDVVRVFGEALTFIERDKRDVEFSTASGEPMVVPGNLTLICTMNPWDKGVDDVDMALERRFAQIDLDPDVAVLRAALEQKDADAGFSGRLTTFFETLQKERNEKLRLGHAYFLRCSDTQAARDVWRLRILPTLRRAAGPDQATLDRLQKAWDLVLSEPQPAAEPATSDGSNA